MTAGLNVWDKLTRLVIFLSFIAYLLLVGFWYLPLIQANENYRKQLLKLDGKIQKETETYKQLHNSMEALRRDSNTVARLARKRLGYGKPGEIIIRFEAPATNGVPR